MREEEKQKRAEREVREHIQCQAAFRQQRIAFVMQEDDNEENPETQNTDLSTSFRNPFGRSSFPLPLFFVLAHGEPHPSPSSSHPLATPPAPPLSNTFPNEAPAAIANWQETTAAMPWANDEELSDALDVSDEDILRARKPAGAAELEEVLFREEPALPPAPIGAPEDLPPHPVKCPPAASFVDHRSSVRCLIQAAPDATVSSLCAFAAADPLLRTIILPYWSLFIFFRYSFFPDVFPPLLFSNPLSLSFTACMSFFPSSLH
jgi:hypothetical protein